MDILIVIILAGWSNAFAFSKINFATDPLHKSMVQQVFQSKRTITHPKDCLENQILKRSVYIRLQRAMCSGVLIDANTVALNGHCLSEGGGIVSVIQFTTGTPQMEQVVGQTMDDSGEVVGSKDLALLRLARSVPSIDPVDLVSDEELRQSLEVVVAGFGASEGRFLNLSYGFGKASLVEVKKSSNDMLVVRYANSSETAESGDSGSPIFHIKDCHVRLAGVMNATAFAKGWIWNTPVILGRPASDVKALAQQFSR